MTEIIWNYQIHLTSGKEVSNGFQTKVDFPHCIGAVDGKHIRVQKPENSGSVYFNYKEYVLLLLLAFVVDSEYRFVYVSIGSYGKHCASSIFKATMFWKKLTEKKTICNYPDPGL